MHHPPPYEPAPAATPETEIAERFAPMVRRLARRHLCGAAEVEDVVQETLRCVLLALRAGRPKDPVALPAYVRETGLRLCRWRRRSDRRLRAALERWRRLAPGATGPNALERLLGEERGFLVDAALARLRKEDRDVLALFYFADLDADEVARRLRLAPGTLRVRKHRALRRLAAEIDARGAAALPASGRQAP